MLTRVFDGCLLFVERREAVKEPPRVDKLLTLCSFPVESCTRDLERTRAQDFLVKLVSC